MQLPIDLLQTFVIVADTRNFTQAGNKIFRSQSAVSQQMKRLTGIIGEALFETEGKRISLTPMGELVLEHAHNILRAHEAAALVIRRSQLKGKVRFGMPEHYSALYLPEILAGFSPEFPDIRVDVICRSSRDLYSDLMDGRLDLIVSSDLETGGETIQKEPVIWAGSPGLPRTGASLPLAVYDELCTYRAWAISALETLGRPYHIAYMSPSIAGILGAVRAGLAVAPIGQSALPGDLRQLDEKEGFPALPSARISMHKLRSAKKELIDKLAVHVRRSFAGNTPENLSCSDKTNTAEAKNRSAD